MISLRSTLQPNALSTDMAQWIRRLVGTKNLNNQAKPGKPKTMDSKAMPWAIKANPVSNTQQVSGELDISQFSVVCHLYNLSKIIWSYWIVLHVTKILQNFWLTLVYSLLIFLQSIVI